MGKPNPNLGLEPDLTFCTRMIEPHVLFDTGFFPKQPAKLHHGVFLQDIT